MTWKVWSACCVGAGLLVTGCEDDDDNRDTPSAATVDPMQPRDAARAGVLPRACDPSIEVPAGLCARIVTTEIARPRHIAVAPNGDLFVAEWDAPDGSAVGGLWRVRNGALDGEAQRVERVFDGGGSGVAVSDDAVFFAHNDRIMRFALEDDDQGDGPSGEPVVVVAGLPADGDHPAKSILVNGDELIVNVGSATNACQEENRVAGSKGRDPCPELETRAGLWRFDANGVGQKQTDGERIVTGLRNGTALAVRESGELWTVQNGRDQLFDNWPELFSAEDDARLPAEELIRVEEGADYGWPYCYWDPELKAKVQAPEYGGDGEEVGRCEGVPAPQGVFPAHWAPLDMVFYEPELDAENLLDEAFVGGAFVSFHGARFGALEGEGGVPGYSVAFVDVDDESDEQDGEARFREVFTGFAGDDVRELPADADHRPVGLAVAPDGALYVGDDHGGTIWRIEPR